MVEAAALFEKFPSFTSATTHSTTQHNTTQLRDDVTAFGKTVCPLYKGRTDTQGKVATNNWVVLWRRKLALRHHLEVRQTDPNPCRAGSTETTISYLSLS